MSSKKTSLKELESIVGRPEEGIRYSKVNNPAINALLEFHHLDIGEVASCYMGLVDLKWIEPDLKGFLDSVNHQADKLKNKLKRIATNRPTAKDLGCSTILDGVDDSELEQGERNVLKAKLRNTNRELNKYKTEEYLHSSIEDQFIKSVNNRIADKVTVQVNKQSGSVKDGKKRYCIMPISDIHWGEVVHADNINGINEYNTTVARSRINKIFASYYECTERWCATDEGIIFMLGDLVAGNIHDELRESNEGNIGECLSSLNGFLLGQIIEFAKHFKKTSIYCVVGNHARVTKEKRFKKKATDSYEYILYTCLREFFRCNPEHHVTVNVSTSDVLFPKVGNQVWKIEHGDNYRGGTGFGSPIPSLTRDGFKDRMMYSATNIEYNATMMGHFHVGAETFIQGDSAPVYLNPSVVGPGEYSKNTCHSTFPASTYLFVTDGNEVISKEFINLSGIRK